MDWQCPLSHLMRYNPYRRRPVSSVYGFLHIYCAKYLRAFSSQLSVMSFKKATSPRDCFASIAMTMGIRHHTIIHTGGSRYPGYMDSCLRRNDKCGLAVPPVSLYALRSIPAEAGIQCIWIPAFVGMTRVDRQGRPCSLLMIRI